MTPKYIPYLFDSEYAWNKTINDPAYSYDMPLKKFMKIYQRHLKNKY
jgi:hypothetical protein